MPFIHVKSLPFEPAFDVEAILEELSDEFATRAGVELKHVTATWQWLQPGHYAVGGTVARQQPDRSHPVLVTLLVPDLYSQATLEHMLTSIPVIIARLTAVPSDNVFVHCQRASSGMVLDAGQLLRWLY
jgi:phenylpyruvate tautomerase PptA (4-oxalocrotonate tautomerase family)